eukprot:15485265-Alexandrium_andersonii.AAC.1
MAHPAQLQGSWRGSSTPNAWTGNNQEVTCMKRQEAAGSWVVSSQGPSWHWLPSSRRLPKTAT